MTSAVLRSTVRSFVECLSIKIFLVFSRGYTGVMDFWEEDTKVKCCFHHITSKVCMWSICLMMVDVDLSHQAEVVLGFSPVEFLFFSPFHPMPSPHLKSGELCSSL